MKPLQRDSDISVFSDRDIRTDEPWRDRIRESIEQADIAILLVSADFLASDFITDHELPQLFEAREANKKTLITLFVSPCAIELHPKIADFQGFNTPDRPLSSLEPNDAERIYSNLTSEIVNLIKKFKLTEAKRRAPSVKTYDKLRDLEYDNLAGQRLFSNVRISLPKLIAMMQTSDISGFSFHDCDLVGPIVLYSPNSYFSDSVFDVPDSNIRALFLQPLGEQVVGVVNAQHVNITHCRLRDIAFVDPTGAMLGQMERDVLPTS